jgi:hypothetical protein
MGNERWLRRWTSPRPSRRFPRTRAARERGDISKAFSGPFEDYAKAISKAKPPKDLKEYHDNIVTTLNDASKAMKSGGGLEGLAGLSEDFPEPPKATQDRLQKIADKNKDCQAADLSFN